MEDKLKPLQCAFYGWGEKSIADADNFVRKHLSNSSKWLYSLSMYTYSVNDIYFFFSFF